MKKICLFFLALGFAFISNAQKTSATAISATPEPTNPDNVKRVENVDQPKTESEVNKQAAINEARFKNMRQQVKDLQVRENSINSDASLTEEQRKVQLEKLQAERDQLAERMRSAKENN